LLLASSFLASEPHDLADELAQEAYGLRPVVAEPDRERE
jgi:hypothetical protein